MLAYEATGPKGVPQAGSLLTMCVVMEISLVLFGVMGTVGVSGMIPLMVGDHVHLPGNRLDISP